MNPVGTIWKYPLLFALVLTFYGASREGWAGEGAVAGRQTADLPGFSSPEDQEAEEVGSSLPVLPQVAVIASAIPPDPGQVELSPKTIEHLPTGDGSLNELLRVLPGIQTAERFESTRQGGEIMPPPVSISGGKVYENNFLLDGFSNNSLLDPAFDAPSNADNVPGHPQVFFLDPELMGEVKVYRSNIPARYGRFAGGVVDAQTRAPAPAFGWKSIYRTTRSEWTRFHLDEEDEKEFENSSSEENQPDFRKHDARLTFDLPLNEKAGLLAHYSLLYSKIPLDHLGSTKVQTRAVENVFLKTLVNPMATVDWATEFIYAPYENEYFLKGTRDSGFTTEGGGWALKTRLSAFLPAGTFEVGAGYQTNSNSRSAGNDHFIWRQSASAAWGALAGDAKYSKQGGYGNIEKKQESVSLDAHFTSEPMRLGELTHIIAAGLQYESIKGTFYRAETATRYINSSLNSNVACAPGDVSCITGEQFMIYKTVHAADRADASVTLTDLYLEESASFGRFSLRPGARLSHDDLLDNTDVAPRLAATFDLFGSGRTVLTAGVNRYYGKTLLTHALAEEKKPYTVWTRSAVLGPDGTPQPWVEKPRSAISATRLADLDTPYTDEVTAGLNQSLFGGELNLLFLDRHGRDELTVRVLDKDANNYVYTEWTNEGKSRHREYSIAWERQWRRQYVLLNATWQETETSHLDYNEKFEGDELEDPVWFHGNVVDVSDLPAPDYNREWTANLVYSTALPYGFSFSNVTRYRSGYRALGKSGAKTTLGDGREIDIYQEVKHPESWVFDWKVNWRSSLLTWGGITLGLEILNVFNEKIETGIDSVDYGLGRQFWAGAEWRF